MKNNLVSDSPYDVTTGRKNSLIFRKYRGTGRRKINKKQRKTIKTKCSHSSIEMWFQKNDTGAKYHY